MLVAKGPFTSVAAPSGRSPRLAAANAALATGGTGDVLAGMCGGLLAQGCAPFDAARLAVGVHALAAERIIARRRWRTLLASDLLAEIPAVLETNWLLGVDDVDFPVAVVFVLAPLAS